ncbi:MAG: ATP synthase subunit I [Cellvibrionales bacterium]
MHDRPFARLRRQLTNVVIGSAVSLIAPVLFTGVVVGWSAAAAFAAGGLVVFLPSAWLAWKMSAIGSTQHGAALAVIKFMLSGLGFALLFAMNPGIHAPGVFAGSAWALVVMPLLTAVQARKSL